MIIGLGYKAGVGKDVIARIVQSLEIWSKIPPESNWNNKYQFVRHFAIDFHNKYDLYNTPLRLGRMVKSSFANKKFADKLKDIVCLLLDCTRKQLEDREFKETPLGSDWDKWQVEYFIPIYFENTLVSHNYKREYYATKEDAQNRIDELTDYPIYEVSDISDPIKVQLTPRLLLQLLGTEAGRQIIHPNIWVNALFSEYKGYLSESKLDKTWVYTNIYPNWVVSDVRFPNEAEAIKKRGGILIKVIRDNIPILDHESEIALDNYDKWDYIIENNGLFEELIDKVEEILIQENII